jgi:hypothetical protein
MRAVRRGAAAATALSLIVLLAVTAHAAVITGGFSVSSVSGGTFSPRLNNGTVTTLGSAQAIDFDLATDNVQVDDRSGDLLALLAAGEVGTIQDFSFVAGPSVYPQVPILSFEVFDDVIIDLFGPIVVDLQNDSSLVLHGDIRIRAPGFVDTLGTFVFTANQAGGTFSFSASHESEDEGFPPIGASGPATALLVGAGLIGLAWLRRRPGRS